jgi:hypothetical protein
MWNDCIDGGRTRPKLAIIVKTASYTITPNDFGYVFTTRGATGAVTFTLPAAGSVNNGEWVLFVNVANQNMTIAGADEGIVCFNDATADAIAYSTTNEKIAGAFLAISDGSSWFVVPFSMETQTVTVTSA